MEKDNEEDEAVCIFIKLLSNCHKRRTIDLTNSNHLQIVMKANKKRKDNLDIHDDEEIMPRKVCLLEYTSFDHISRQLKRKTNGKQ